MPYIGTSPSNGVRRVHTYTATASQTTFTGASSEGITLSYVDANYLDVFQNGVLLGSADYTSTSGTSVVLAQGASADDLIVIVVYDVFSVADTVSKTNGGSFDSGVTMSSTLGVTGATTLTGSLTGTTATLSTDDNNPQLTITSTDADANAGPEAVFDRNSSSPADSDRVGKLTFKGRNDANQVVEYGNIQQRITDASDGTEDGRIIIQNIIAGDVAGVMESDGTETIFNNNSKDLDFRVESAINTHAMFVQGSDGRIGFNTVPDSNRRFHIKSDQSSSFIQMIEMTSTGAKFGLDLFTSGTQNNDNNSEFIRCRDTGAIRFRVMSDGDVQNDDNSYGSTSDVKLKEQITDASSQWEDIKALKVRKFKLKEDVANGDSDALWKLGVIAQEVETAGMSGLVKDNPDLVEDDDGLFVDSGTVTKSVKYSILYMKAVKALQEAMTRIETLEAKVTALENAE